MDGLPLAFVRTAYIKKVLFEKARRTELAERLTEDGFEQVDSEHGALVTDDGRPIMWAFDSAWAPRAEVHAEWLKEAMARAHEQKKADPPAEEPETKSVAGTESLSVLICPKCGDMLQHSAVCPSCAAGQLGYRHRYVCVCGGVDMVSKEKL